MCRAYPSMTSYWLRWASSAMTTMFRRSERTGWESPDVSGKNFWMVVNTTPPTLTESFCLRSARAFGLGRVLPEEFAAPGEGAEELVVQVVTVGEYDDGGVFHVRVPYQGAGVEGHGQALARALVVPDDSDSPVPRVSSVTSVALGRCSPLELGCSEGLCYGRLDGVELVIPGHLLDELPAPVVVEGR